MKIGSVCVRGLVLCLALLVAVPPGTFGQQTEQNVFKQEELDQLLAPIALYPDALLTQMLMASTYPLEVVQADRWLKKNKELKGDALAVELEKQNWDPSVKSLVNFPDILSLMSDKLELTVKLGDAFLAQQKDVLDTVQKLRKKAEETGNLKTTKEQVVKVEKEVIVIESSNPEVIYVPSYNSTVVYGSWWYPSYPPYPYYPPAYYAPVVTPYAVAAGIAIGAAWGYAWGHADWHGGDVDIDYNRNTNINRNIDRGKYKQQFDQNRQQRQDQRGQRQGDRQAGQGNKWQHNPDHRKGVNYRDQATGQRYNRGSSSQAIQSREGFRGRAEAGRQDIARGGADSFRGGQGSYSRGGADRGSAFSGMDRGGGATRDFSSRGSSSRAGGGYSGGGSRGGGGFSGGGGRGGGGGARGGGGGGRGGGGGGGRR